MGVSEIAEISNSKKKLEYWKTRVMSSFLLSLIVCISLSTAILLILSYFEINWSYKLVVLLVIILVYTIIALIKNFHLKKFKKGKIGILLAIDDKGEYEGYKIKTDLLDELNKNLDTEKFQIILVSNYWAKKIHDNYKNGEKIAKYHNRIGGIYRITGNAEKENNGGYKCFIETEAMVFHKEIPAIIQNELGIDFSKMYLKEIEFDDNYYKSGIKFSGKYNGIVAKYIIGVAFFISGAPISAWNVHKGLNEELNKISEINNINQKINEQYFKLISEKIKIIQYRELQYIVDYYYQIGDNENWIKRLNTWKNLSIQYGIDDAFLLNNLAIYEFLINKDISKSRKLIKETQKKGYKFYRYSLVFLDLRGKDYKKAKNNMKTIIKKGCKYPVVLESVIKFIDDILINNEDRFEFLYREALLHYKQEYNLPLAFKKLEKYISMAGNRKYEYELDNPKQLLKEIEKQMYIK